jgi:hypothetical protein
MEWILRICIDQLQDSFQEEIQPMETQRSVFYFGNVTIQGDFHPKKHTYVLGDLNVTGIIYGDIHLMIVVGGNIKCSGMLLCRTYLFALKDIDVRKCLLQTAYGFTMLAGKLKTNVLIDDSTCVFCDVSEDPLELEKSNDNKLIIEQHIDLDNVDAEDLENRLKVIAPNYLPEFSELQWQFDGLFQYLSKQSD